LSSSSGLSAIPWHLFGGSLFFIGAPTFAAAERNFFFLNKKNNNKNLVLFRDATPT
jgi:hypothetical protein